MATVDGSESQNLPHDVGLFPEPYPSIDPVKQKWTSFHSEIAVRLGTYVTR